MTFLVNKINRCDIYVGANLLLSFQGILYPQGYINQSLQLIVLLWSTVIAWPYMIKSGFSNSFLINLKRLIFLFTIYGVFALMFGYYGGFDGRPRYLYLQRTLSSLLPIFVYGEYAWKGYLSEKRIKVYFFIFLLTTIFLYYQGLSEMILNSITGRTEFTMNLGYQFLTLVPMVCIFNKRPIIQYILMLFLMYWLLICYKRGAILIGAICFLYFLYNNLKNSSSTKKGIFLIITVACLVIGYKFFMYMLSNSDYFLYRFENTMEGNSSARDDIYNDLWTGITEKFNVIEWLFGRGGYSTYSVAGAMAHNDWLEILCNNGVVGIVIFTLFILGFFRLAVKCKNIIDNYLFVAFVMAFFITFFRTMFSQSIMVMTDAQDLMIGFVAWRYLDEVRELASK